MRTILLVEDDVDVRSSVAGALEDEGHRVLVAENGREGLRLIREERHRPDLILLDMMMPEMNGWEFREEQVKDPELAAIPVIVFTAYGVPTDTAAQLGVAGFLKKPLRLGQLLDTVERMARQPEASPGP
jgi:CheY-like chemotaxis protein